MKKSMELLLLCFILLIGLFLRFYRLDSVPRGLYQDETSIGYSAYSLLTTGKDEYGKSFPLYFKSFGDQKLPVYIYTVVVPVALFGLNAFAVRFPSALFGFLTLIVFYLYTRELTKNSTFTLIATALLSINPWSLFYNRATFEVSMSLFFFLLGGYLLHLSLGKKVQWAFVFGTICFIISLYSYNLTRLLAPLLFVLYLAFYRKELRKSKKTELSITGVVSVILLLPFAFTFFRGGGVSSAQSTLIFSSAQVQAPLLEFRTYLLQAPSLFAKLFFNLSLLTLWEYLRHITSYFSVDFYFLTGDPHGNHGIGTVGQLYLFEFPLILFGIAEVVRKKMKWMYLFLIWGGLTILVAALTREAPQATRSYFLVIPLELLSAIGLLSVWELLQTKRLNEIGRIGIVGVVGVFILYNLLYYFVSYYVRFPISYAKDWRDEDRALSLYLKSQEATHQQIVIDPGTSFIYTSYLFYTKYPPADFQRTVTRGPDDEEGFSAVHSFGQYTFAPVDGKKVYDAGTLLVVDPLKKPDTMRIVKVFKFPKRTVVYPVQQELHNADVEDVAYEVVTPK